MPNFAIDDHPQRQKIIDGILAGKSTRYVGDSVSPRVPHTVVQRYKVNVIKPMLQRAEESNRILIGNKILKPKPADLSEHPPAVQAVQQAIQDAPALSLFRQRIEKINSRIDRHMDKAETAIRVRRDKDGNEVVIGEDLGVLAPLINQAHKNAELLGRATGELEPQGGSGISIQIVCPSAPLEAMPRVSFASQDAIEAGQQDAPAIDAAPPEEFEDIGVIQMP